MYNYIISLLFLPKVPMLNIQKLYNNCVCVEIWRACKLRKQILSKRVKAKYLS